MKRAVLGSGWSAMKREVQRAYKLRGNQVSGSEGEEKFEIRNSKFEIRKEDTGEPAPLYADFGLIETVYGIGPGLCCCQ
jgi:hypothetical protein